MIFIMTQKLPLWANPVTTVDFFFTVEYMLDEEFISFTELKKKLQISDLLGHPGPVGGRSSGQWVHCN